LQLDTHSNEELFLTMYVGLPVGDTVGAAVGDVDGTIEGIIVGGAEGFFVGTEVGSTALPHKPSDVILAFATHCPSLTTKLNSS
jgi:hypothetical protein